MCRSDARNCFKCFQAENSSYTNQYAFWQSSQVNDAYNSAQPSNNKFYYLIGHCIITYIFLFFINIIYIININVYNLNYSFYFIV